MKKHLLSRSSSRRTVLLQLSLIIGVAISAIALQSYAANSPAFVQPSVAPPGGNAFAPLNVGTAPQIKNGGLKIGGAVKIGATTAISQNITLDVDGNSAMHGDSIIWGNLSIGGPIKPGTRLNVNGNMAASAFYDMNNTNYYVNPASTSNLNSIKLGNAGIKFADGSVQTTAPRTSSVSWNSITGKPAGFVDGIDNIGTLKVITISVAKTTLGSKTVTANCPSGYFVTGGGSATSISYPNGNGWSGHYNSRSYGTIYAKCAKIIQ